MSTSSRLVSVHLESAPSRREEFRAARDRLRAACGDATILGVPPAPDDPTATGHRPRPAAGGWLRDGGVLHPLGPGVNSVGRLDDNSIVLRDEHVSRRHCAVVVHSDGRVEVHDVASKNGTVVNGRRISGPTRLRTGDLLTLCNRHLVYLAPDADLAAAGG